MSFRKYQRIESANRANARGVRSALGIELREYVLRCLVTAKECGALIERVEMPFQPAVGEVRGHHIIIVYGLDGKIYPFNVKSGHWGAMLFRRDAAEHKLPQVPVIVVKLNDAPQVVLDRVATEAVPLLKGFKLGAPAII